MRYLTNYKRKKKYFKQYTKNTKQYPTEPTYELLQNLHFIRYKLNM